MIKFLKSEPIYELRILTTGLRMATVMPVTQTIPLDMFMKRTKTLL